jgi:hypothetical protein
MEKLIYYNIIHYIDKETIQHKQYFRTYNSYSHILEYLFIHYFEVVLIQSSLSSVLSHRSRDEAQLFFNDFLVLFFWFYWYAVNNFFCQFMNLVINTFNLIQNKYFSKFHNGPFQLRVIYIVKEHMKIREF